jgi:hypothetical protein
MKKIMLAGLVAMASMSLVACDRTDRTTNREAEDDNKVVVDRDSVPSEYEVTETVVEYDTTTRTKTVDSDKEKRDNDKDNKRDNN